MNRQQAINHVLNSDVIKKWHFFKYHFFFYNENMQHPFAESIIDLVTDLETVLPKSGMDYLDKIAAINDKPSFTQHYDQLLQTLAELVVVHKAAMFNWGDEQNMLYEPTAGNSKKNPEIIIHTRQLDIGIEVKAPEFVKKHNERGAKALQMPSRSDIIKTLNKDDVLLPRDHAIKDFLISADNKFSEFKRLNPKFYSVLVIVWDDFVYEPISALISPQSGLFTANSFAKDLTGKILEFSNLDCVIITRHLLPIKCGTRDEPIPYSFRHSLDFGGNDEFPFKVYIQNPSSKLEIPKEVLSCFQALKPSPKLGAEYLPIDFITWY